MEDAIIVCYRYEYVALKEYIKSNFPNNKIAFWADESDGIFTEARHYMVVRHVPHFSVTPPKQETDKYSGSWRYAPLPRPTNYVDVPLPMFISPAKVSFINTEHMSDITHLQYNRRYILSNVDVYDYSLENIKIFGRGTYLPYRITEKETSFLKRCLLSEKKYDVCVIFTPEHSDRRKYIVDELIKRGVSIDIISQKWGDDRDYRVGQSRILLNVHYESTWLIYESIRCERWRAAGMTIISERSNGPMPDGVIEASYDKLVETVIATIAKLRIRQI